MKLKIGVIFGGESVEHEVSIISAVQAMHFFDEEKYEIIPIYIAKNKECYTGNALKEIENYQDLDNLIRYCKKIVLYNKDGEFVLQSKKGFKRIVGKVDLVLPIVHGANVEDGTLAGYFNLIGVPFVGCDIYAGVVGQDKVFMKQIFEAEGIPITEYEWFFDSDYKENPKEILDKLKKLKFPLIVKPSKLGSSIGVNVVKQETDLENAIEEAIQYDSKVVVEEMVPNLIEVNCSVLGNYEYQQTSEIEEMISKEEFLTYHEKYVGDGKLKGSKAKGMAMAGRKLPASINDDLRKEVRDLAKKTFRILNASGVSRIDFLIDSKKNKVYVNEINTIPGCLSFYLWDPIGKNYTTLLDDLISAAIKDYKRKSKMIYSFETNILRNLNGLKGNKGKLKFRGN